MFSSFPLAAIKSSLFVPDPFAGHWWFLKLLSPVCSIGDFVWFSFYIDSFPLWVLSFLILSPGVLWRDVLTFLIMSIYQISTPISRYSSASPPHSFPGSSLPVTQASTGVFVPYSTFSASLVSKSLITSSYYWFPPLVIGLCPALLIIPVVDR